MKNPHYLTALIPAGLLMLGVPQIATAQTLNVGGKASNFGSISLAPGFTPDPHQVSITSGGSLNVGDMNLGSGCVGYGTGQPDFILRLSGDSDFIKFYNEGNGDTGLVINDPNGRWHCDDDSHSGTNPMVEIPNAADGQYDVWVTSYSSEDNISSTLHVSELRSSGTSSSEDSPLTVGGDDANFGSVSLQPGFTPDPHEVTITSGGTLAVSGMNLGSGCVGYATTTPDLILNLSGATDFLRFYVEGNGDTGLVINDPTSTWHCDDDTHTGTNPMLDIENAPAGQYDVWISSYSSEDNISAKLFITELRTRPNSKGN